MPGAPIQIFACQNRTCRRDGSQTALEVLRHELALHGLTESVELHETGCLGQCGNGPMLMVLQTAARQEVWYDRVQANEIPLVVKEHLLGGRPVGDMLYRAKHPKRLTPGWTPLPPPWHQTP